MGKRFKIILAGFLISGTLYFLFAGLIKGKEFLIPISTAAILSMVLNPVARKLKAWGLSWGWSVFLSDLIVVVLIGFMVFLLAAQAGKIAGNWEKIEDRMKPRVERVERFLNSKMNISFSDQQNRNGEGGKVPNNQSAGGGKKASDSLGKLIQLSNIKNILASMGKNIFSLLGDILLVLVYVFFFMYYQKKFEDVLIKLAPDDKSEKTKTIISESAKTAQEYLLGRFTLILILAGLYILGYSIAGLKYAVFISLIAALFSLIPYLGNLVGLILAVGASALSGGGSGQIVTIVLIFAFIQFVESYILEPFVVGKRVDLNPVAVIVGVVLGGSVWGVMGMILSIPVLGIIKVIFDHIEVLNPLGYALDARGIATENGSLKKIKEWFQNKIRN